MKIGVIGGGAIGLLVSSHLAGLKHNLTIYVRRQEQKNKINQQGITLFPQNKTYRITSLLIKELKKEDLLIVCVKQYHLCQLLPILKRSESPVIFSQNGMGHIDDVLNYHFDCSIMVATCEHGSMRESDTLVNHTGIGKINLAILQGDSSVLAETCSQLDNEDFPFVVEKDWFNMLAKKLVVNVVINTITGLFQVKNGELLTNPHLKTLAHNLCFEASNELSLNSEDQWVNVLGVIERTKNNQSSMKLDILHNRKTEIEGISGYLLYHAKKDTPYIKFVHEGIKALEWKQRSNYFHD